MHYSIFFSQGYYIDNKDSLALKMLDFYGNWNELQTLATLTQEKLSKLSPEEQKKLGLENASQEMLVAKRETPRKTQECFMSILRVFAPAQKNMQHPNITLEITVQPKQKDTDGAQTISYKTCTAS